MRGKDGVNDSAQAVTGITPACAGKSFRAKLPILSIRDHPRVCGEKEARAWPKEQVWGSPPRMRGKVAIPDDAPRFERITPAYAGKSRSQGSHTAPPGDHPRVCGEKTEYRALVTAHQGSPPRMRGKVDLSLKVVRVLGITPACAGKSCPFLRRTSHRRDHPRVCGEKGRQLVK